MDKKNKKSKLLVLDNYDSFTYNLVQMFMNKGLAITVKRSNRISLPEIKNMAPDYILISPGPKDPASTGVCKPVIEAWAGKVPILGVCLGMQCINEVFGGKTVKAPLPVHGKTSQVFHENADLFSGVPSPFTAARYHSLVCGMNGGGLKISATSEDGVVMGLYLPGKRLHGVQFHPESFLTEHGFTLIENFLNERPPVK